MMFYYYVYILNYRSLCIGMAVITYNIVASLPMAESKPWRYRVISNGYECDIAHIYKKHVHH